MIRQQKESSFHLPYFVRSLTNQASFSKADDSPSQHASLPSPHPSCYSRGPQPDAGAFDPQHASGNTSPVKW